MRFDLRNAVRVESLEPAVGLTIDHPQDQGPPRQCLPPFLSSPSKATTAIATVEKKCSSLPPEANNAQEDERVREAGVVECEAKRLASQIDGMAHREKEETRALYICLLAQ